MPALGKFLTDAWHNYLGTTPQARDIARRFHEKGETLVNDHIALRTLAGPKSGIEVLAPQFEALGLKRALKDEEEYRFPDKQLRATYFHHPSDATIPKVFVSELLVGTFRGPVQEACESMLKAMPRPLEIADFTANWRPWDIRREEYHRLAKFSEYASWVYALGFRVNHFTVSVNHLKQLDSVAEVNKWVTSWGHKLNKEGGEIKGSTAQGLVQSSTLADRMELKFLDGVEIVPTCYFEFAQRFPLNGELYQGFIPASADKIFESTKR